MFDNNENTAMMIAIAILIVWVVFASLTSTTRRGYRNLYTTEKRKKAKDTALPIVRCAECK